MVKTQPITIKILRSQLLLVTLLVVCLQTTLGFHIVWPNQHGVEEDVDVPEGPQRDRGGYVIDTARSASWRVSKNNSQGNSQIDPDGEVRGFTRNLLKNIAKRTSFANSEEEIQQQTDNYDQDLHNHHESFDSNDVGIGLAKKRSVLSEYHTLGCEAKVHWEHLGADHYPRYLKTYICTSDICGTSFGECRPKNYTVMVLRMKPLESLSDEPCDQNLPETLRCDWQLISRPVTTYCECFQMIGK